MKIERDWKEEYVDLMGLIVAMSGEARFTRMIKFKSLINALDSDKQQELKACLRQRFTPSNGQDGCQEAVNAIQSAIS